MYPGFCQQVSWPQVPPAVDHDTTGGIFVVMHAHTPSGIEYEHGGAAFAGQGLDDRTIGEGIAAASLLRRHGFSDVGYRLGGFGVMHQTDPTARDAIEPRS